MGLGNSGLDNLLWLHWMPSVVLKRWLAECGCLSTPLPALPNAYSCITARLYLPTKGERLVYEATEVPGDECQNLGQTHIQTTVCLRCLIKTTYVEEVLFLITVCLLSLLRYQVPTSVQQFKWICGQNILILFWVWWDKCNKMLACGSYAE